MGGATRHKDARSRARRRRKENDDIRVDWYDEAEEEWQKRG